MSGPGDNAPRERDVFDKIDELIEEAAYRSEWIGRSYIRLYSFPRERFARKFCRFFRIPEWKGHVVPAEKTALECLVEWLGEEERASVEELIALASAHFGVPGGVWHVENEAWVLERLSGRRGRSGFFFTEDLFFAEFGETVLCFIMGNNE